MEKPRCRLRSRYAVDLELRHADAVLAEVYRTRRQTLNQTEVVISEDKLHAAATAVHSTARSCSCTGAGLSAYPYSLEYQSESLTRENDMQRILFLLLPSSHVHALHSNIVGEDIRCSGCFASVGHKSHMGHG